MFSFLGSSSLGEYGLGSVFRVMLKGRARGIGGDRGFGVR